MRVEFPNRCQLDEFVSHMEYAGTQPFVPDAYRPIVVLGQEPDAFTRDLIKDCFGKEVKSTAQERSIRA